MLEVTIVQGIFYHQNLCDRHLQKEKVKRTSKWVAGNKWGLELPDKIPKSSLSFVHIPARGCSYHFHFQNDMVRRAGLSRFVLVHSEVDSLGMGSASPVPRRE